MLEIFKKNSISAKNIPYVLNHNFSAIIFYIVPIYIRDWPVLASIFSKVGCSAFRRVDFCARPVAHF